MNDFTKDELYDLQSWGDAYTAYDVESDVYKMHELLLNKLQSMIDNYCEHGSAVNVGGWEWKCAKCGIKFGG